MGGVIGLLHPGRIEIWEALRNAFQPFQETHYQIVPLGVPSCSWHKIRILNGKSINYVRVRGQRRKVSHLGALSLARSPPWLPVDKS